MIYGNKFRLTFVTSCLEESLSDLRNNLRFSISIIGASNHARNVSTNHKTIFLNSPCIIIVVLEKLLTIASFVTASSFVRDSSTLEFTFFLENGAYLPSNQLHLTWRSLPMQHRTLRFPSHYQLPATIEEVNNQKSSKERNNQLIN